MDIPDIAGKIIGGTGHRPNKLPGGYYYWPKTMQRMMSFVLDIFAEHRPARVVSGMAQGWDTVLALAAIQHNIPLHAYIPCREQAHKWPSAAQELYKTILSQAEKVHCTSESYTKWCMSSRNIDMIEASDLMLAMWDGSGGGTGHCVDAAGKRSTPVVNLWDTFKDAPHYHEYEDDPKYKPGVRNAEKRKPSFIDTDIRLEEPSHTYILGRDPDQKFISCTTLLKPPHFPPFDGVAVATNLVATHHRYKDRSVEELVAEWNQSGIDGTKSHLELELYIQDADTAIETIKAKHGVDWTDKILNRDEYDWYPEVILYNTGYGVAGTADLIIMHRKTKVLYIFDWKTNKKINMRGFRGKKGGSHITKHLDDCEFSKYSLQLSIYRFLLENDHGYTVGGMNIVHLTKKGHKVIPCDYLPQEAKALLAEAPAKLRTMLAA